MTTLAKNKTRDYSLGDEEEYPVVAADIIYQGAAVGENGLGYSRPLVAADPFQGFAIAQADNSTGGAGETTVRVKARGRIVLDIPGVAITANDRPAVYAADDDTFTLDVARQRRDGVEDGDEALSDLAAVVHHASTSVRTTKPVPSGCVRATL